LPPVGVSKISFGPLDLHEIKIKNIPRISIEVPDLKIFREIILTALKVFGEKLRNAIIIKFR
jgi:hypothetical protein